ncbi:hydroxyphenylacetyl-CoA thioesterase PaaI [Rhizorhabdus wittichii]|uniref:hydroxyphenylacetyl-CoA thioesterase PaaI n=1 Tax=Rhizorhabdus wittichii TaxID=160791 RepID=UPI00030EA82F|nr:hydroxyphenylacetyl-CoA thioesterase PaaI [Rhizorhabdus wittichii]
MTDDILARRVAERLLELEGTAPIWGIVLEEARVGYARLAMTIRPDMTNGHGSIHGGMIFALADTAFAYACNSRNVSTVAQGASILFLAPAHPGEELIAEATEQAVAGRSGAYSVAIRTRDGRAIAQFQGHSRAIGGQVIEDEPQGDSHG